MPVTFGAFIGNLALFAQGCVVAMNAVRKSNTCASRAHPRSRREFFASLDSYYK